MRKNFVLTVVLTTLLGSALAAAPAVALGSTTNLAAWNMKSVGIPANAAAFDAGRGQMLVTVPSGHPSLGNMLVEVNPNTGAIGRHVYVGSDPESLALTDDGSTAYVALGGVSKIVRVDLNTFTVANSIIIANPYNMGPPRFAYDLVTLPGRSDLVVASLMSHVWPRFDSLVVFKDGISLPNRVTRRGYSNIELDGPDSIIGYDDEFTDGLGRFRVDGSGITLMNIVNPSLYPGLDIEFTGGEIFTTNGRVIDGGTYEERFAFPLTKALVEATAGNARVTYLANRKISVFDLGNGAEVGSRVFSGLPDEANALVASLDGFVVASAAGLYLLGPSVTAAQVQLPAPQRSRLSDLSPLILPFSANDLVYDESRQRIYATVSAESATHANRLVAFDSRSGAVLATIAIGGNPHSVAINDARSLLFVTRFDNDKIDQVDLNSFEITSSFALGNYDQDPTYPLIPDDIEVRPGTVDSLAVTSDEPYRTGEPRQAAIYRAGVKLSDVIVDRDCAAGIEFVDAGTLYGIQSKSTGFDFITMAVDGAGVRTISRKGNLTTQYGADLDVAGGKVFVSDGLVVDPDAGLPLGQLDASGDTRTGKGGSSVEPVLAWSRVFQVIPSGLLEEYDSDEFRRVGKLQLDLEPVAPRPMYKAGPAPMISTGSGLAIGGDKVVLLVPKTAAPPPPAPTPALGWGYNMLGAVGNGGPDIQTSPSFVVGQADAAKVSAGLLHSLKINRDGTVWAWGYNALGNLGDGTTIDRRIPVQVPGLTNVVAVAPGFFHNLALRSDGTVWAWGWNHFGQLGDGTTADRRTPVQIPGLTNVSAISVGAYHSMALKTDGSVLTWGWNVLNQLGDGTIVDRHQPNRVNGLQNITAISAGGFHSTVVDSSGAVWSWGWNAFGQLGNGNTADQAVPVRLNTSGIRKVSSGYAHNLALDDNGRVLSWGWNVLSQLGDGTTVDRRVPTLISSPPVTEISAGFLHSLAISDNNMYGWGYNSLSQLGEGNAVSWTTPTRVPGAGIVYNVSAGGLHSLAVRGAR